MNGFFVSDFSPFLYESNLISIRYYSLFFGIGLFYLFYKILIDMAEDINRDIIEKNFFNLVIFILIGSRLFHCLFYEYGYYSENFLEIFIPFRLETYEFIGFRGLSSHGGLAGALLYIFFVFRKNLKKEIFFKFLDSLVLNSLIFISLIRFGNFFNSEIIGKKCAYFFCVIFPYSGYGLVPRHPVQLYEAFFYLFIFLAFAMTSNKKMASPGKISIYLITLTIFGRFILEFFKERQSDIDVSFINMGQFLSLILYFLFLVLYSYYYKELDKQNN